MKLVGLVGSNAEHSYNRLLLKEIKARFQHLFSLEILEISRVPLFNVSADDLDLEDVQYLNQRILEADGVIIATPEHNHTIPPALKSVLEWLSYKLHPFEDKPVMVVGASYDVLGTSRSQLHLRQILEAPGLRAHVFPGNEFLLGKAKEAFDENGRLVDAKTIQYLSECIEKFVRFVHILKQVEQPRHRKQGIIHQSYQLGDFSKGMDDSEVAEIIQQLKSGEKEVAHYHVPTGNKEQYIVHTFQTVTDEDGSIVSIEEFIMDYAQIIEQYLKQTGQSLTNEEDLTTTKQSQYTEQEIPEVDVSSSASQHLETKNPPLQRNETIEAKVDATSSPTQLSAAGEAEPSEKAAKAKFIYVNEHSKQSTSTQDTQPQVIKVIDVGFDDTRNSKQDVDTTTTATVKHLNHESKKEENMQDINLPTANVQKAKKSDTTEAESEAKSGHRPTMIDATSGASDQY